MIGSSDTLQNSGELKEEVVKARKEEGQDYFDDYETEKKVFEEDSAESDEFGIDKDDSLGAISNEFGAKIDDSKSESDKDSNESDSNYSYLFDDNLNESNEFDVLVKDSPRPYHDEVEEDYDEESDEDTIESDDDSNESNESNESDTPLPYNAEVGEDYNDDDESHVEKSSRKTFYQSHIYPMHLLENLKVCLTNVYILVNDQVMPKTDSSWVSRGKYCLITIFRKLCTLSRNKKNFFDLYFWGGDFS